MVSSQETAGVLDVTLGRNTHTPPQCLKGWATLRAILFLPVAVTEITMETAPHTPFSFFLEFRVFLVGGEGKDTKCSSSKATSAFCRAV